MITGSPVFPNSALIHVPEWMILRGGSRKAVPVAVRYGVFRHPSLGLTLVDTGYGPAVTEGAGRSLSMKAYAAILKIRLVEEESPQAVLSRSGLRTTDVDTILLSHFHADHTARLREFPNARILAPGAAYSRLSRARLPYRLHNGYFRELMPDDFEARMTPFEEFDSLDHPLWGTVRDIAGDGSCLTVSLPGHAHGHCGFVFSGRGKPLLYAVDAQWCWRAIAEDRYPGLPASAVYSDADAAIRSCERVRIFARSGGQVVLCHDPSPGPFELEAGQ